MKKTPADAERIRQLKKDAGRAIKSALPKGWGFALVLCDLKGDQATFASNLKGPSQWVLMRDAMDKVLEHNDPENGSPYQAIQALLTAMVAHLRREKGAVSDEDELAIWNQAVWIGLQSLKIVGWETDAFEEAMRVDSGGGDGAV